MPFFRLRTIGLAAAAAGVLGLPACSLPRLFHAPEPKQPPAAAVAGGSDFKVIAPGQRIPKAEVAVLAPPPAGEPASPIIPPAPTPAGEPNPLAYAGLLQAREPGPRPDGPLVAALRAHLDNQYGAAVNHLGGFDRPNQELLLLLLPLLDAARTADLTGRDPRTVAALARQLDAAAELVTKLAPLEIKTTAFVSRVDQYGVYQPRRADFLPGGQGQLYAEIDRTPVAPYVQPNGSVGYVTKLAGSIQLKDEAGQVVAMTDRETGKKMTELALPQSYFSLSPVRDFFLTIEFPVPEKPGRYSLILDVRDPNPDTPRRSRKVVEFQVGP